MPLRAIFEALGSKVDWDGASRTVTAIAGSDPSTGLLRFLKLTVGQKAAYLAGRPVELDVPAKIINGRTMVPVCWVAEALRADVEWDGHNQVVQVKTSGMGTSDVWSDQVEAIDPEIMGAVAVVSRYLASLMPPSGMGAPFYFLPYWYWPPCLVVSA